MLSPTLTPAGSSPRPNQMPSPANIRRTSSPYNHQYYAHETPSLQHSPGIPLHSQIPLSASPNYAGGYESAVSSQSLSPGTNVVLRNRVSVSPLIPEDSSPNQNPYSYTAHGMNEVHVAHTLVPESNSAVFRTTQFTSPVAVSSDSWRHTPGTLDLTEPRSVPEAADPATIRKILCLDGGGVRGLSEIMILKFLMQRLGKQRGFPPNKNLEPWQEFDMICGTSTGGLLAIMLGRLKMSLKDCEEAYLALSAKIFTPARGKANVVGKAYDFLQANGRFQSAPLEDSIKSILRTRGIPEDQLLWEDDLPQNCKV